MVSVLCRACVQYDLRFPAPTKCCCLAKPLDSVSMKASDPRTYCQALDSVHGRVSYPVFFRETVCP